MVLSGLRFSGVSFNLEIFPDDACQSLGAANQNSRAPHKMA